MSKGRVFRVVIDGRGLDLIGAFSHASARDWAALIGATGRNPFEIGRRLAELDKMKAATDDERGDMLAGPMGTRLLETVADLVFLSRRREGDREPGTDRPLTYETCCDETPIMGALGALVDAMGQAGEREAEPDPT